MKSVPPLFANLSHEIRTPMNGVIGMLELLSRTGLDGEQRHMLDVARNSADALMHLLDNVLDFTKVDAGKLDLESIEMELRPLAEEVITLFSRQAQAKGIQLHCVVHHNVPAVVRGDPTRIRQVMTNLVSNAVKFTDCGEVFLGLRGRDHQAVDDVLPIQIVVRDTGIGMSREFIQHLFQPFIQADNSTARKYGGTGLGLAITRHLVEAMGGSIKVGSEPDAGTTFSVFMPMPIVARTPSAVADLRGVKALIIDDDVTNLCVLEHYAASVGVQHHSAHDAEEGLRAARAEALKGEPFDIVLLDFQMPQLDGENFLKRLRADPTTAQLPCIILSTLGERVATVEQLGVAAWLNKPVRQSQLQQTLATVLGRVMVGGAPAAQEGAHDLFFPGARVLLVENDTVNRQVAQRLLRTFDIKPQLAGDGLEALEQVRREPFDLILMDCQMPVMDGYGAAAAIRQWEKTRAATPEASSTAQRLPIVALTANATEGDRQRCFEAGMDEYLSKPVRREALGALLARHLKHDKRAVAPALAGATTATLSAESIGPALDETRIRTLCEIFPEDFSRVVDTYLREAPQHLESLGTAGNDATQWCAIAHTLKSASRSIGAREVAELAARLELITRAGALVEEAHELRVKLHQAMAEAAAQLRTVAEALMAIA